MNKTELIAVVAEKAELSKKDAEKAIKAFTDAVSEELVKGGKIQLVGFGTFEVAERAAREGRNPKTGETKPKLTYIYRAPGAKYTVGAGIYSPEGVTADGLNAKLK